MITHKEIGLSLGISAKAARVHLDALVKKNLILSSVACRENSGQPEGRHIRITKDGASALATALGKEAVAQEEEGEVAQLLVSLLLEDEIQYLRAIAAEEIVNNSGVLPNDPSGQAIEVYLKNNLPRFIELIKFRRYVSGKISFSCFQVSEQHLEINCNSSGGVPSWFACHCPPLGPDACVKAIKKLEMEVFEHPEDIVAWCRLADLFMAMGLNYKVQELYEHLKNNADRKMATVFHHHFGNDVVLA